MKLLIAALALLAVVAAFPQQALVTKPPVPILAQETLQLNIDGSHRASFESADGQSRAEQGLQKSLGPNDAGEAIQGQFSYTGDDGQVYSVSYTADENGYQPQGNLVPAIPEAIKRALEWNAAHPEEDNL